MKKGLKPEPSQEFLIKVHNDDGSMTDGFMSWATDVLANPPEPSPSRKRPSKKST